MRVFSDIRLKARIHPNDPVAPVCDMIEAADHRQELRASGMAGSLINLSNMIGDLSGDNTRNRRAASVNCITIAGAMCVLAVCVLFAAKMIISVFLADTKHTAADASTPSAVPTPEIGMSAEDARKLTVLAGIVTFFRELTDAEIEQAKDPQILSTVRKMIKLGPSGREAAAMINFPGVDARNLEALRRVLTVNEYDLDNFLFVTRQTKSRQQVMFALFKALREGDADLDRAITAIIVGNPAFLQLVRDRLRKDCSSVLYDACR